MPAITVKRVRTRNVVQLDAISLNLPPKVMGELCKRRSLLSWTIIEVIGLPTASALVAAEGLRHVGPLVCLDEGMGVVSFVFAQGLSPGIVPA